MGRLFLNYLPSSHVYICAACESHLADREDIMSKVRRRLCKVQGCQIAGRSSEPDCLLGVLLLAIPRCQWPRIPVSRCVRGNLLIADVKSRPEALTCVWTSLWPLSVNVCTGVVEKRMLRTGQHEVADIYCKTCQQTLGWKYVRPRSRFSSNFWLLTVHPCLLSL